MTLHEQLVEKWSLCEYGIKQKVFRDDIPQASVQYILSNPNYRDQDKIQYIIDRIEFHSNNLLEHVKDLDNKIQSI